MLEVENILKNVHRRNKFQLNFLFKKKFLDSFRTLVETLILLTPSDSAIFNLSQRYKFTISLANKLFDTLKNENYLIASLTYPLASIFFTLMSNLRQVMSQIKKQQLFSESLALNQNQKQQQTPLNTADLFELFKKLLNYLLNSSLTNLKVRTHLYATILNYLSIFDDSKQLDELYYLLNGDKNTHTHVTSHNIEPYSGLGNAKNQGN